MVTKKEQPPICPYCKNDGSWAEIEPHTWGDKQIGWFCNNCSKIYRMNGDKK